MMNLQQLTEEEIHGHSLVHQIATHTLVCDTNLYRIGLVYIVQHSLTTKKLKEVENKLYQMQKE